MNNSKIIFLKNVNIQPESFHVRTKANFSLSFSLNLDLPQYSKVILRFRGGRNNKNDWYFLQAEDINKNGFVSLNLTHQFEILPFITTGKQLTIRYLILESLGISKGTTFLFTFKNTLVQSIIENRKKIEILIQIGKDKPILAKNSPILKITNRNFANFTIISPSIVKKSEQITILFRAEDKYFNLVKDFTGNIKLSYEDDKGNEESLEDLKFIEQDKGIKRYKNLSIKKIGIFRVKAVYKNQKFWSNPILCKNEPQKKLFWGFIHGHTQKSDGMIPISDYFQNLVDADLDFGTNTEHDRLWETKNQDFLEIKKFVEKINEEGNLLSLFGYEWGSWYSRFGDICIYHKNDTIPILRSELNKFNSTSKLIKNLKKYRGKVLLIGHHTALRPGFRDWRWFDADLERLVEIYSCWGNQEYSFFQGNPLPPRYKFFGYGRYARKRGAILEKKGSFVQDALMKGYKLGFTAGGDDHFGIYPSGPVDPDNGIYPPGIMAIWASNLNKKNLWKSLISRKCYGTTGPRVIIEFFINHYEMGDICNVQDDNDLVHKRKIKFKIISSQRIEKIHLVRNNEIYKEFTPEKEIIERNLYDKQDFFKYSFMNFNKSEKVIFYYLRIFLERNQMAWSSPIWIITKINKKIERQ